MMEDAGRPVSSEILFPHEQIHNFLSVQKISSFMSTSPVVVVVVLPCGAFYADGYDQQ